VGNTLEHLAILTTLTVGACTAVLAKIGWPTPIEHLRHHAKDAAMFIAAVVVGVWASYMISWLFAVATALWGLAALAHLGQRKIAKPHPTPHQRQLVDEVLPARLETSLGLGPKSGWDHKITIEVDPFGKVIGLTICLPLGMSNKKLADPYAAVCSDVMDGHWNAAPSSGNSMKATLGPVDEPLAIPYLAVLRHPKLLGEDSFLVIDEITDTNIVKQMTARFSQTRAAEVFHGDQRSIIERKFNELCPAGEDQKWLFEYHLDKSQCTIKRSTFERIMPHKLINQPALKTTSDAAAYYPELIFARGIDDRGNLHSWPIGKQGQVDALICGAQGSGKSAGIATMLTEAIAGGCAAVLTDFKYSDSYDCFADLPNIHLYTNKFDDNLRAISYVEHVMRCRNNDTRPPVGAPPKGTCIVLFIDEAPTFFKDTPEQFIRLVTSIQEKGRSQRMHVVLAAQNITARTIPTDNLRLCSYREQWGYKDISESLLLWGNSNVDVGSKVPIGVPGRGVVTSPDGKPVFIQGFYTPGTETNRPLSAAEQQILDALRQDILETVIPLYERMQIMAASSVRPGDTDIWTAVRPRTGLLGDESDESDETVATPLREDPYKGEAGGCSLAGDETHDAPLTSTNTIAEWEGERMVSSLADSNVHTQVNAEIRPHRSAPAALLSDENDETPNVCPRWPSAGCLHFIPASTGRPRRYCSDRCRKQAHKDRGRP
jgi:hypothetical protein